MPFRIRPFIMKTFVLFFIVLMKLVFASIWTNVTSGALEFPSLVISEVLKVSSLIHGR